MTSCFVDQWSVLFSCFVFFLDNLKKNLIYLGNIISKFCLKNSVLNSVYKSNWVIEGRFVFSQAWREMITELVCQ